MVIAKEKDGNVGNEWCKDALHFGSEESSESGRAPSVLPNELRGASGVLSAERTAELRCHTAHVHLAHIIIVQRQPPTSKILRFAQSLDLI